MARDEALLQSCSDPLTPPVLRFYAWSPATISLGYFQEFDEAREFLLQYPLVRRATGGGAILHDLELTYSLTIPIDHPLIHRRPNELYRLAHSAILETLGSRARFFGCKSEDSCAEPVLHSPGADPFAGPAASAGPSSARRGPFFCFHRRHDLDLVADLPGRASPVKIAGSAQRRSRTAILQHGSLILDSRDLRQQCATWKQLIGPCTFSDAARLLIPAFERRLNLHFAPASWSESELQLASRFEPIYAGEDWTRHRRRPS